jgi:hypothetical protein
VEVKVNDKVNDRGCKMKLDYMAFDTAPLDEECVQVGDGTDYFQRALREGLVYKRMLSRIFGLPTGRVHFFLKKFEHDFGSFVQVCVAFDSESIEEKNWVLNVEANLPLVWDEKAKSELNNAFKDNKWE